MPKDNCSKHPTSILGESDMKVLAGLIGDLRYEKLAEFTKHFSYKIYDDAQKDAKDGKVKLSDHLGNASASLFKAHQYIELAWQKSKPFMETKK